MTFDSQALEQHSVNLVELLGDPYDSFFGGQTKAIFDLLLKPSKIITVQVTITREVFKIAMNEKSENVCFLGNFYP